MSEPLVSIVIPVFNGSDFLREAIESALAQTYPNFEIIVVNDGSKDDGKTRDIALSYGDRIRYLEKENGGVATALNAGIRVSNGKYISWLSHDDAYVPEKLAVQVPVLEKLEGEGRNSILYSSFLWMDDRSVVYGRFTMPKVDPSKFFEALLLNTVFDSAFKRRPFSVHGCTLLIPKRTFEEVGYFDESLRTTQDFDLWFKVMGTYDFIEVEGYLVRSRVHKGQGTFVLRKERVEEVEDLYLRAFLLYSPRSERFDLDLARAVLALKVARRMKAYSKARVLLKEQGCSPRSWTYAARAVLATKTSIKLKVIWNYGIRRLRMKMAGEEQFSQ